VRTCAVAVVAIAVVKLAVVTRPRVDVIVAALLEKVAISHWPEEGSPVERGTRTLAMRSFWLATTGLDMTFG
jgi:hypothetical protein